MPIIDSSGLAIYMGPSIYMEPYYSKGIQFQYVELIPADYDYAVNEAARRAAVKDTGAAPGPALLFGKGSSS